MHGKGFFKLQEQRVLQATGNDVRIEVVVYFADKPKSGYAITGSLEYVKARVTECVNNGLEFKF
jgi:hypothetical protein